MTSASPIAGRRHWSLFRATCPTSDPSGPASSRLPGGSNSQGRSVAISPSDVFVTRSAAWTLDRSASTSSAVGSKCAGMYIRPPQNPPPAPPPPPPEPPPLKPPPPPLPPPDEAGEFPIVPRADIIPPRSGTADPEKMLPPEPDAAASANVPPDDVWYHIGKYTDDAFVGDSRTSSRLRCRTLSISDWRPSAVPHTTAWSGVSSQVSPAPSTTCCIVRDCSIVFWS